MLRLLRYRMRFASWAASVLIVGTVAAGAQVYQPTTCHNAYTQQQEIEAGDKIVAEVYRQMPVLPDSDPVSRYVQSLGERLVSVAPPTPGLTQPWPFRFHVVASEDINAFALPGGTMFVNLGAIRAAETEAQLAGVMGHEMSHVILRHSTCNLTQQRKKSILYGIGAIGSAILLGDKGLGSLAQGAIGLGENLDFLHMSRADEQQADLLGVQISHDAGFDPRGLPQFFEIIQAKSGAGGAQFLSDHPNPGNRTEYVNAEISQLSPLHHPVKTSQEFVNARNIAGSERVYNAQEMKAGQWRATGLYVSRPGGGAERVVDTSSTGTLPVGSGVPVSGISAIPLSRLGLRDRFVEVQMPRYSLQVPQSWQRMEQKGDSVTIAPPGAAGSFGVAYGVLAGVAELQNDGVEDERTLELATDTIAQKLQKGSGLTPAGTLQRLNVNGQAANMLVLRGTSPVYDGAQALPERDVLVVVARPDADVVYLVFVAPERDFNSLQPTFNKVLAGLRLQ